MKPMLLLAAACLAGGPCPAAGPATRPAASAATIRRLDRTWRRLEVMPPNMSARSLFDFALEAAAAGYHPERITRALGLAECMQDRAADSRTFGNFRWYWHAEKPEDRNAVEFCMQKGVLIRMRYRDRLDREGSEQLDRLIDYSADGIARHNVRVSYTNIFLMKAWNCIAIGEVTGQADLAEAGRQMLRQWMIHTWESGISEYISPTYYGVDLESLGLIARHARSAEARREAEVALRLFWADVAANWFEPCGRLGGAHSRDYDYLTGHGYLDSLLRALGRLPVPKGYEPSTFLTLCKWAPPEALCHPIASAVPRTVRQRWGPGPGQTAVHYVGQHFSVGSAGANYGPMDKVLTANLPGGPKTPMVSFVMDVRGDPYGRKKEPTGGGHSKAFHVRPLIASVQRGPEVLLVASADPNTPAVLRYTPKPTCLLSHVVIPRAVEVWAGGRRVQPPKGGEGAALPDGPAVLRLGDVAVGVWMKPGPVRLVDDGGKYAAMRLTVTHAAGPPTKRATVAVWLRAAEGLDDAGFEAFRRAFRGPLEVKLTGDRVAASAPGGEGPLRLRADVATGERLLIEGAPAGAADALLAVNGRDVGREILRKSETVATYAKLLDAVERGAAGAPAAGSAIEAEAAAMILPPFRAAADPRASGGKFVWAPGEAGGRGSAAGGRAVWLVYVPAAGDYVLTGRVRTPTPEDDSFFVTVRQARRDVLARSAWHTGQHKQWQWVPVTLDKRLRPAALRLAAGSAVIEFRGREDGARLDAIRLAPAAAPAVTPKPR